MKREPLIVTLLALALLAFMALVAGQMGAPHCPPGQELARGGGLYFSPKCEGIRP
jgi:hypothetical protein